MILSSIITTFAQALCWVLVKVRTAGGLSSPKSAAIYEITYTTINGYSQLTLLLLPVEAVPDNVSRKTSKDCPASIIPSSSAAHTSTDPSPSFVLYVGSSRVTFIRAAY